MLKGTAIFPLYWPFHIFHLFHKSTENVYKGVNLGPFISSFEDSFCILFKEMEKLNKIIQEFPTSRLRNKYKRYMEKTDKISIVTCSFKGEYFDNKSKSRETINCDQEHLEGKDLCLFHDESFLDEPPENKDKVIEKLYAQMDKSISKNEPLHCIGYYLPDIQLDKKFTQLAYFNHCKFQNADFSNAEFSDKADFSSAEFKKAFFSGTKFSEDAFFPKLHSPLM